jgi:hypothetical protein
MSNRATPSGIVLSSADAAIAKGMLRRGDRQHDIAAWFGVNGGRIAEIANGTKFSMVVPSDQSKLPPPGPYPAGRIALEAITALRAAKQALARAEMLIQPSK